MRVQKTTFNQAATKITQLALASALKQTRGEGCLLIIDGNVGSGKTVLASALLQAATALPIKIELIEKDRIITTANDFRQLWELQSKVARSLAKNNLTIVEGAETADILNFEDTLKLSLFLDTSLLTRTTNIVMRYFSDSRNIFAMTNDLINSLIGAFVHKPNCDLIVDYELFSWQKTSRRPSQQILLDLFTTYRPKPG
ncbi:MAG: hypothetical protein PHH14_07080 [Candidatus Margulisbacteria bacterium]|nr:hypothetical protein [Candidatus Margulisiibacteriota bacterium]